MTGLARRRTLPKPLDPKKKREGPRRDPDTGMYVRSRSRRVGRQTPTRAYVPEPSCLPLEYWRMDSPSAYRS